MTEVFILEVIFFSFLNFFDKELYLQCLIYLNHDNLRWRQMNQLPIFLFWRNSFVSFLSSSDYYNCFLCHFMKKCIFKILSVINSL